MTKTEELMRAMIARNGYYVGTGKRQFEVAKRLRAANAFPGARWSIRMDAYQSRRSNRLVWCYDVTIHAA